MDENEGAKRALIQSTRRGIDLVRDQIELNRKLARAYMGEKRADVALLPDDLLHEYEAAVRKEAESSVALADALRVELDSRR